MNGAEGIAASFTVTLAVSAAASAETDHIEFEDAAGNSGIGGYVGDFEVLAGSTRRNLTVRFLFGSPPQGQYSGVLRFYLCKDDGCQATVAGSPFSLPYRIVIGPAPAPQVTPTSLSLTAEANDRASADLSVRITAHQATVGMRVGVSDPHNRFEPEVQLLSTTNPVAPVISARVRTIPLDTSGSYTGQLTVFLCTLTPCVAASALPGSHVTIPYSLQVTPISLLQPVPTASGLPEWETFQGTHTHTGYVSVTLDPARFQDRWTWIPPENTYYMNPVTTGSGKVVVSWINSRADIASLFAINESNGVIAWRRDFAASGVSSIPEAPAAWGGRVFVSQRVPDPVRGTARSLQSFSLSNGVPQSTTRTESQHQTYLAPTVYAGFVYSGGGEYGGAHAFNAGTGVERWFTRLSECQYSTPAADAEHVYAIGRGQLTILNRLTGVAVRAIEDATLDGTCMRRETAPVLPGDGSVVLLATAVRNEFLVRYDISSGTESWRASGTFTSNPVVAGGVLYVLEDDSSRLEARSLLTGEVLWSWNLPEPVARGSSNRPVGNLLLTDNLIFVATRAKTYAVDLQTHAPVWSTPRTGHLALSSSQVLYIATTGYVSDQAPSTGRIDAIDLAGN